MSQRESLPAPIPYPSGPLARALYRSPMLLWRMGWGPLFGWVIVIVTTFGRKSGLPRRVAVEFHAREGRKYTFSAWGEGAQWYRNIQANPHVTIQTSDGTESVIARRVTSDDELNEALDVYENNPIMKRWAAMCGFTFTREAFLARKDQFYLITFDPTDEPTPPPLETDLVWVSALLLIAVLACLAGVVWLLV
jgi:deazaflavin-dependent oxidoreductase (nitroreductase family)